MKEMLGKKGMFPGLWLLPLLVFGVVYLAGCGGGGGDGGSGGDGLTLLAIEVTPANTSMAAGTTRQFTATGIYSDTTRQDLTASVAWRSSNDAAATVSDNAGSKGLVACVAEGSAIIAAITGNVSGNTTVAVTAATTAVPGISLSPLSYNFGSVVTGNSSNPREIMLSNTGSAELHVSGIVLSDTTNFTLDVNVGSNPCGSTSPTIPTAQNCTVSVQFGPFSTGVFSSTLRVDSDDPDTPSLVVSLTGSGTTSPPSDKTITLAWDPPTTDVNGNPITDSVGYILYYGPSHGNYDHSIDVGNVTTYSVTLPPGAWYFSTRAYITLGFESNYSNEIQINI